MKPTDIPLPKEWPTIVKSAVLQVISLAHYVMTYTRSWCANSRISRLRSRAKLELVEQEIALLTEELRIKDARDKQDTGTTQASLQSCRAYGYPGDQGSQEPERLPDSQEIPGKTSHHFQMDEKS